MKTQQKLFDLVGGGLPRSTVQITGRSVEIRAFTVKELKLLMMAHTSETAQEVQILNVLQQCLVSDVDVKTLPSIDVEKLYVELYALSKGSSLVPIKFTCRNEHENGEECGHSVLVNLNLAQVETLHETINKIDLGSLTLIMRQPTALEMEYFEDSVKDRFNLAMRCVSHIETITGDVYTTGVDIAPEELAEVVDMLTPDNLEKIMRFATEIPTLKCKVDVKCPNCGHTEAVELVGLADFFG